ncbi:MAG TPA: diacylglycerol kinase family protein [Burkholderiales bacterium]|nr:diacylglycerol kinase family protein [Burkholderiales bacterium]
MQVTLIHNPGAGSTKEKHAEGLVAMLRDAGHEVRYQSSQDDDWDKVLEAPADLVVVAGGDGTVSRVAKRLVGAGIPLAPLPCGTANNISRSLGLVDRPFEELVRGWPQARRVKLDVGVAEGPWGRRYFVEGLGIGLFASLLASDPKEKLPKFDKPQDTIAHALERMKQRVQSADPIALNASLDGKDISGRYLLLEAVNILYVGPSLFLAPDSKPGDGFLDVVLVTEAERDRLRNYLAQWQDNKQRLAVLPSHRGKHLSIEWTGFDLHIDDKLWPKHGKEAPTPPARIEATLQGAAVEFLAPAQSKA